MGKIRENRDGKPGDNIVENFSGEAKKCFQ